VGLFASTIRAATNRGKHEYADRMALRDLPRLGSPGLEILPRGLSLRWLGTASFELTYEGTRLLIDPYVTRLGLRDLLRGQVVHSSREALSKWVPSADAVLVGHTHFDHALDVPAIAERDGCPVYGGTSVAHLMALHGLQRQAVVVGPYEPQQIGPFSVTFVPSVHSKLLMGWRVPAAGEITCDHLDRMVPRAFRCGQVWGIHVSVGGVTLYHQGSADLVDDAELPRGVDVFLCGIAGRQCSPRYLERVIPRLDPRVIVPSHFDDFFTALDMPMGFTMGVNLAGFPGEVARVSGATTVCALDASDTVYGGVDGPVMPTGRT